MRSKSRFSSRLTTTLLAAAIASIALPLLANGAAATTSRTGPVSGCVVPPARALLAKWGDTHLYFVVRGGNVERYFDWRLGPGSVVVPENEPWRVLSPMDQHSVQVANGSTASVLPTCVPFVDNLRMFVKVPAAAGAELHIHLDSVGSVDPAAADFGKHHSTTDYVIRAGAPGWTLVGGMKIPDGRGGDGTQNLTITLGTAGTAAAWKVDDILMDPWKVR